MIKNTNNITTIGNKILNAADTVTPLVIQPPPPKDTHLIISDFWCIQIVEYYLIISCPWETTTPPIKRNFRSIQVVKYKLLNCTPQEMPPSIKVIFFIAAAIAL